jgi:hypothetical protein
MVMKWWWKRSSEAAVLKLGEKGKREGMDAVRTDGAAAFYRSGRAVWGGDRR